MGGLSAGHTHWVDIPCHLANLWLNNLADAGIGIE